MMCGNCWVGLTWLLCCGVVSSVTDQCAAGDLPSVIDSLLQSHWSEQDVQPADEISDAHFLRRVTLDLAGRVPTLGEYEQFVADHSPEKRTRLVDELLSRPDYAWHLANELDRLLLARIKTDNDFREYLLGACRENRSWDRIFREVLTPEHAVPDEKGPAAFVRERVRELDDLTNDTAVLFFGVNIGCAKCHDHPLVADWQQQHYYGMQAFFHRTYRTKSGLTAEKFEGRPKFKTVDGEEFEAVFMFLDESSVDDPAEEVTDEERKARREAIKQAEKDEKASAPRPEFSPRRELVRLALEEQSGDFFARNFVNRTWARLLGRGLVHPLDQMHSENPASHPELLTALARDFRESGYDIQRLVRGIVLSRAYALSSAWNQDGPAPNEKLFARGVPRALSARQVALSLDVATHASTQWSSAEDEEARREKIDSLNQRAAGLAGLLEDPAEGFQVSVEEALLFANSERIERDYLRDAADRLVGELKGIDDNEAAIRRGFRSILSREPSDEELSMCRNYLTTRADRRVEGLQQLTWSLLASPEFRFNH